MSKIALLVGSVYGGAEEVAENALEQLNAAGHNAEIFTDATLDQVITSNSDLWLVITSTTGQGDVPPNLSDVFFALKDTTPNLSDKQYAVICMGDSSYVNSYCEAGKQFDEIMYETMAKRIQNRLEIDACEVTDATESATPWIESMIKKLATA